MPTVIKAASSAFTGFPVRLPRRRPRTRALVAAFMAGAPPTPEGGAAVGALAALELVLLLAGASEEPRARRIEIFRGTPLTRATARQAGCACSAAPAGIAAP